MKTSFELTDWERGELLETLYSTIAEVEQSPDISQGVITQLHEAVNLLGGSYESIS